MCLHFSDVNWSKKVSSLMPFYNNMYCGFFLKSFSLLNAMLYLCELMCLWFDAIPFVTMIISFIAKIIFFAKFLLTRKSLLSKPPTWMAATNFFFRVVFRYFNYYYASTVYENCILRASQFYFRYFQFKVFHKHFYKHLINIIVIHIRGRVVFSFYFASPLPVGSHQTNWQIAVLFFVHCSSY